jgi:hypothetical protein
MEGNVILYVSIWAAVILAGLGLLGIALFGLRNLAYGKVETLSIGTVVLPALIFVGLGVSTGTWAQAGIVTVIVMFGFALLGLVYSGIQNLTW